jgi:hypothetical protein
MLRTLSTDRSLSLALRDLTGRGASSSTPSIEILPSLCGNFKTFPFSSQTAKYPRVGPTGLLELFIAGSHVVEKGVSLG